MRGTHPSSSGAERFPLRPRARALASSSPCTRPALVDTPLPARTRLPRARRRSRHRLPIVFPVRRHGREQRHRCTRGRSDFGSRLHAHSSRFRLPLRIVEPPRRASAGCDHRLRRDPRGDHIPRSPLLHAPPEHRASRSPSGLGNEHAARPRAATGSRRSPTGSRRGSPRRRGCPPLSDRPGRRAHPRTCSPLLR